MLFRVLNMNYYKLSEPAACKDILNKYKEFNDPVRQFWNEFKDVFVWDLLPFTFLYDLYKEWFKRNSPSGTVLGRNIFIHNLKSILSPDDNWQYQDSAIWTTNRMDKTEWLIRDYNLTDWMHDLYRGENSDIKYRPKHLSKNYRGLLRK